GRDVAVLQEPGEAEPDGDPGGDPPVVADDEVPPEAAERAHTLHAGTAAALSAAFLRRRARVSASETSATYATTPSTATSAPGKPPPRPHRAQKMPTRVSSTRPPNLGAFSGPRSSGPRTASPTATTSTTAAAAAAAARPSRPCVEPKVITMKATSSPSSRTP